MTQPLHVLVWGHANDGPCAFFRGYQYDEPLRALGVEMRHIKEVKFKQAKGWENRDPVETLKAGKMEVDTSDLEWADVIVMRWLGPPVQNRISPAALGAERSIPPGPSFVIDKPFAVKTPLAEYPEPLSAICAL